MPCGICGKLLRDSEFKVADVSICADCDEEMSFLLFKATHSKRLGLTPAVMLQKMQLGKRQGKTAKEVWAETIGDVSLQTSKQGGTCWRYDIPTALQYDVVINDGVPYDFNGNDIPTKTVKDVPSSEIVFDLATKQITFGSGELIFDATDVTSPHDFLSEVRRMSQRIPRVNLRGFILSIILQWKDYSETEHLLPNELRNGRMTDMVSATSLLNYRSNLT